MQNLVCGSYKRYLNIPIWATDSATLHRNTKQRMLRMVEYLYVHIA